MIDPQRRAELMKMCDAITSSMYVGSLYVGQAKEVARALREMLAEPRPQIVIEQQIAEIMRQKLSIQDDSEEWQGPSPHIEGIYPAARAIIAAFDRADRQPSLSTGRVENAGRYKLTPEDLADMDRYSLDDTPAKPPEGE